MKFKKSWIFLALFFCAQLPKAATASDAVDYGYLQLPCLTPEGMNVNFFWENKKQEKPIMNFSFQQKEMAVGLMMKGKYSPASVYGHYGIVSLFLAENYFLTPREPQIETLWRMLSLGAGFQSKGFSGLLAYSHIGSAGFKKEGQLLNREHVSIQNYCRENGVSASGLGFILAAEKRMENENFFFAGKISGSCLFFDNFKYYAWEKGHQNEKEIMVKNSFLTAAFDFIIGAKIAGCWQPYFCCRFLAAKKTRDFIGVGINYYHE